MEVTFVLLPTADECLTIFIVIISLMTIKIHPIVRLPILPAKRSEPALCRALRDYGLEDLLLPQHGLHLATFDNIDDSGCLQEASLCLLHHSLFDFLCDIFILKCSPLCLAKAMEGELVLENELQNPFLDVSCPVCAIPLSL